MGDFNESVKSKQMHSWAQSTGLEEIVSPSTDDLIATQNSGSLPIDGIYVSPSLTVQYSGYLPFGVFQTDHRTLWADLTQSSVFGFKIPQYISPQIRILQCNVPHVREAWIRHYTFFLQKHKVIEKQFELEAQITSNIITDLQAHQFEKILQLRTEGINYAEKRCRKIYCGNVPFSLEVQKARLVIELWKADNTIATGRKYSSTKFRRLEKKTGITQILNQSKHQLEKGEDAAFQRYWKMKRSADRIRDSFLHHKAESIAEDSNVPTDSELKQPIKREKDRHDNRKIKVVLKKIKSNAITTIEVEQDNGSTIELTNRHDIERVCLQENFKKYSQTESTICMQEPLRSLLGKTGETSFSARILDGTAILPPGTPLYTRELFQQLQRNPASNTFTFQPHLSSEDFKTGWTKMKETTSAASKSGLHFGHLKACACNPLLTEFESSISHIPFTTVYVPTQWKESLIVMIKKKAGLNTVHSLRSIVLTEADFNFNNKILERRAIQQAEDLNDIAPEQYGSRKHKSSIDQALHKRISYCSFWNL